MNSNRLATNPRKPFAARATPARAVSFFDAAEDAWFWLRQATWNRAFCRFDHRHGTRTGGSEKLTPLGVTGPAARFGRNYQPIDPGVFRRALQAIQAEIVPGETTFVDLGCGKGRALILAAELPFREIIGVEIAPSLAEEARQNLARTGIQNARVVRESADAFAFPPGPLAVYLFNPFVGPIFRRTMLNLCRSTSGNVFLIYIDPTERAVLGGMRCFRLRKAEATFEIYRHGPHAASGWPGK
jgi:SAM-dependent methyltransferase